MPEIIFNIDSSDKSRALMAAKGQDIGLSVEWTIVGDANLTAQEMQALKRKHQSRNVNYKRAAEVKRLIGDGLKCNEIAHRLHRKYGRTMVKKDHAALTALLR